MYKNIVSNRADYFNLFRNKLDSREMFLLEFAYDLAKYAHGYLDQVRDGGERYFNHPREVSAIIATEFKIFDLATHIAALFHDCDEDTFLMMVERIRHTFGDNAADAVKAVTKKNSSNMGNSKYLEQYFKGICSAGWRACVIKCADRLHNLRTLLHDNIPKIKKQISETVKFFVDLKEVIGRDHNEELSICIQDLLTQEIKELQKVSKAVS